MNTRSIERQLQQVESPPPDPAARVRARQAALEEFRCVHQATPERASARGWRMPRLWLGGFATACAVVVSVSIAWLAPRHELQPPAPAAEALASRVAEPVPVPPQEATADAQVATPGGSPQVSAEPPPMQVPPVQAPPVLVDVPLPPPPGSAAATPVATITGEEIRALGLVNVADSLIATPPPSQPGSGSFPGDTVANLRGQDPTPGTRSLTLVDGRRAVSASNQADVIDVTGFRPVQPARGDQFEEFVSNPVKRTVEEPVSTFSVDVDTASYTYVRRMLNSGTLPVPDAVRVEEMINYFDYDWPAARARGEPLRPTVTVSDSPWGAGRKLVHVAIKGYEVPVRVRPDMNLVLLVDVSGSMNSPDKLPLAKHSMKLLLDSLRPTDTVAIAVYAGAAGQVLPPTPARERERIEAAIDALRPGGSTAGAQGIRLAYELARRGFREGGVNRILLATDGDFNVGISDPGELTRLVGRERQGGVYLSVLGFGEGNYRDDIAQALAQNGNGVAAYIDSAEEAHRVLVQQAGAALVPIAGDVKIQVEFNPATVAEYRLVGYETRALQRQDFNNDRVDAGDVGSGHTVTAIYEITPVGSPAQLLDAPRYGTRGATAAPTRARTDEYGYLRIRYKLPGEDSSKLIEERIRVDAGVPARLRHDVAFSTAVAGFAQLLRGSTYTGSLTWDDVIRQASGALGPDTDGHRAAFVELVRRCRDIQAGRQRALF